MTTSPAASTSSPTFSTPARRTALAGLGLLAALALSGCDQLPATPRADELNKVTGQIDGSRSPNPDLRFADYLTSEAQVRFLIDRAQTQYDYNAEQKVYIARPDLPVRVVPTRVTDATRLRGAVNVNLENLPVPAQALRYGVPVNTVNCQTTNVSDASRYASYAEGYFVMGHPGIAGGERRYVLKSYLQQSPQEVKLFYANEAGELSFTQTCRSGVSESAPVVSRQTFNLNLRRGWNAVVASSTVVDETTISNYTTFDPTGDTLGVTLVPVREFEFPKPIAPSMTASDGTIILDENCELIEQCTIPARP